MLRFSGLIGLVVGATCYAAGLPFIEVDPAGTTAFRERGTGKPFAAVGLNYFDPETGWAPKIWQQFDEKRVDEHLRLIQEQGFNTIRVFITLTSFEQEPGKLTAEGTAKFRKLLDLCRSRSIYVIPTGPELWEGSPAWRKGDRFADEPMLAAEESWWREFAAAFADEPAILAYDLANEPMVNWDTPAMHARWNEWLEVRYGSTEKMAAAWSTGGQAASGTIKQEGTGGQAARGTIKQEGAGGQAGSGTSVPAGQAEALGSVSIPPNQPARGNRKLLDYQRFREHIGGEWSRRMIEAIRSVDRNHMVTVGHIQWVTPVMLPAVWAYAGFDLKAEARYVDFATVHFYPIDSPRPCDSPEGVGANAVYLQALLRDCSVGKPLMLGEFNWYGGGGLQGHAGWELPDKPVEHQVEWCRTLLEVTGGRTCGWLNWAFADTPTARDISRWSGCWTTDLKLKPWGRVFGEFARASARKPLPRRGFDEWLTAEKLDRDLALTDPAVGNEYRQRLRRAATQPH